MRTGFTIQKGIGLLLLTLFTFSATPKQFLHDLLANHQDEKVSLRDGSDPVLHAAGFHCDCKYPVVHAPFTETPIVDLPAAPITWLPQTTAAIPQNFTTPADRVQLLRGPPSLS